MSNRIIATAGFVLVVSCGGSTPVPAPAPEPAHSIPTPAPAPAASETSVTGTVRVNVSTLNVRREASLTAEVVERVRRGERLTLLAESGDWLRVRLHDGTSGWVASQLVVRDDAAGRPRRAGCAPDSGYSFVSAPKPSFSENGAHGIVVIEATVDAQGVVTKTRVVSNETHDDSLASLAEREIRAARFAPPVRNCAPRAFFFTYKRAF
ncbi:MAG TPA: SH3 domain-containing protein [Thermoanaerobaculia bacterium]|nr:SH3 domain-containing protein [Thermoanaerobaculia bacterium]